MKLYHGSNTEIVTVSLEKCEPFKDFGKGFYTTNINRHASERAISVVETRQGKPVVTVFEFDPAVLTDGKLSVKRFSEPSPEWVEFVMHCRDRNLPQPPHLYDIVEGPVANDKMRTQFSLFERGILDIDTVLKRITYIEDTHQISFHTPAAIALLKIEPDYPLVLIESAVSLVVEYLIEDRNLSIAEALDIMYNSATYEELIDRSTMLYRESPPYIYELLKREIR
jgi:hypothetical protein